MAYKDVPKNKPSKKPANPFDVYDNRAKMPAAKSKKPNPFDEFDSAEVKAKRKAAATKKKKAKTKRSSGPKVPTQWGD